MRILLHLIILTFCFSQSINDYIKTVEYLSSDTLEGRGFGSKGLELSAHYISEKYKMIGLKKLKNQTYFQQFNVENVLNKNVIGIIPAKRKSSKSIIFIAHYDGLGIGKPNSQNDSVYNGALDNAVGVAALVEFARYYKNSPSDQINYIFIASSAEEIGSYGSQYYIENPIFPLGEIKIVINLDGFNVFGQMKDYMVMPKSGVSFYSKITSIISKQGFDIFEPNWIEFMNDKFDTKPFLKSGVPAFTLWAGDTFIGKSIEESLPFKKVFGKKHHSPDDEIAENWNWKGVQEQFDLTIKIVDYFIHSSEKEVVLDKSLFD